MKNTKFYTFQDHLKEMLADPEFKKEWEKSEPEYLLAKELIEKRTAKKLSQRQLARQSKTSQAVISRIESMHGNPTFSLLKRLAKVLDAKLILQFK